MIEKVPIVGNEMPDVHQCEDYPCLENYDSLNSPSPHSLVPAGVIGLTDLMMLSVSVFV